MSEHAQEPQEQPQPGEQPAEQQSTFNQADVDRIVADRLKRERDKIGDVKALRSAADELAAIKESQKSDAQKQADRVAALEAEMRSARTEALRLRIGAKFGFTGEFADKVLTAADEQAMTGQAEGILAWRAEQEKQEAERKKQGNYVPREGHNPNPKSKSGNGDMREFTRNLFAND